MATQSLEEKFENSNANLRVRAETIDVLFRHPLPESIIIFVVSPSLTRHFGVRINLLQSSNSGKHGQHFPSIYKCKWGNMGDGMWRRGEQRPQSTYYQAKEEEQRQKGKKKGSSLLTSRRYTFYRGQTDRRRGNERRLTLGRKIGDEKNKGEKKRR